MDACLAFDGNAEEAFKFYRSIFGGEFTMLQRFKESPDGEKMPKSDQEKIMYVSLPIGERAVLMGWDHLSSQGKPFSQGNNFCLALTPSSKEEAKKVFHALVKGGKVDMPLQDTFWNAYFGMLTDKFGIQWLVSYDYQKTEGKK